MSRRYDVSDVAEVLRLPARVHQVVPPEYEDLNGHMNIRHYFALQTKAIGLLTAGLDDKREQPRIGGFSLEHHLIYHAEVLVGREVSVHARLDRRTDKVAHGRSFLVDRTMGRVANTCHFVLGNVDLTTRRMVPFLPAAARFLDQEIRREPALPLHGLPDGRA